MPVISLARRRIRPLIERSLVNHLLRNNGTSGFSVAVVVDAIRERHCILVTESNVGRVLIDEAVVVVVDIVPENFSIEHGIRDGRAAAGLWIFRAVTVIVDAVL